MKVYGGRNSSGMAIHVLRLSLLNRPTEYQVTTNNVGKGVGGSFPASPDSKDGS